MFNSARLKLTAWYLFIIMFISITFSVGIYRVLVNEFERFDRAQRFRIERTFEQNSLPLGSLRLRNFSGQVPPSPELIEEAKQRIFTTLIFVNFGVLILSGGLGYFLAGRTLRPIKEMVDEQNRFISDASHELKTPLTSLKSAFEVYLRDENPSLKEAKTIISESITEVDKLQLLSESMLQLAQYQKQDSRQYFEKVSLKQIIQEAVKKIEPIAKKQKIEIIQDVKAVEIEGNKYSLIDLMVIFLDNAIKYSLREGKVIVEAKKMDGFASIIIKDQGIGIDEKDIPKIFDRFYRADSARLKENQGGYGLGLSIAKKIVDAHKGSIKVESKLKKGSTFTIHLPVHQSSHLA